MAGTQEIPPAARGCGHPSEIRSRKKTIWHAACFVTPPPQSTTSGLPSIRRRSFGELSRSASMEQQVTKKRFSIVKLEERIAPSCVPTVCKNGPCDHVKGNNGWGNGEHESPGKSG